MKNDVTMTIRDACEKWSLQKDDEILCKKIHEDKSNSEEYREDHRRISYGKNNIENQLMDLFMPLYSSGSLSSCPWAVDAVLKTRNSESESQWPTILGYMIENIESTNDVLVEILKTKLDMSAAIALENLDAYIEDKHNKLMDSMQEEIDDI